MSSKQENLKQAKLIETLSSMNDEEVGNFITLANIAKGVTSTSRMDDIFYSISCVISVDVKENLLFKALLIMAWKREVSGRELGKLLNVSQNWIARNLRKWIGMGLIERRNKYRIKDERIRAGFTKIVREVNIENILSSSNSNLTPS